MFLFSIYVYEKLYEALFIYPNEKNSVCFKLLNFEMVFHLRRRLLKINLSFQVKLHLFCWSGNFLDSSLLSRRHRLAFVRHVRLSPGPDLPHRRGERDGGGSGWVWGGEESCTGEEMRSTDGSSFICRGWSDVFPLQRCAVSQSGVQSCCLNKLWFQFHSFSWTAVIKLLC